APRAAHAGRPALPRRGPAAGPVLLRPAAAAAAPAAARRAAGATGARRGGPQPLRRAAAARARDPAAPPGLLLPVGLPAEHRRLPAPGRLRDPGRHRPDLPAGRG